MARLSLEALLQGYAIEVHHVIEADEDVHFAARALRARLRPGQRVLLARYPQRSPWSRIKSLFSDRERDVDLVALLAGGLLMAGFEAPSLAAESPELVAVWAHMPTHPDPLDRVFSSESLDALGSSSGPLRAV